MKAYKKGHYTISAERVEEGTELYNFLEDCHYVTDAVKCIRLIGTAGEEWPVTIEKLAKTYTYEDGTFITEDNIPEGVFVIATIVGDDAEIIFAERTTEEVKVVTGWGEILTANRPGIPHGKGDYMVYANKDGAPDPDNRWVVNGEVFPKTYEEA